MALLVGVFQELTDVVDVQGDALLSGGTASLGQHVVEGLAIYPGVATHLSGFVCPFAPLKAEQPSNENSEETAT